MTEMLSQWGPCPIAAALLLAEPASHFCFPIGHVLQNAASAVTSQPSLLVLSNGLEVRHEARSGGQGPAFRALPCCTAGCRCRAMASSPLAQCCDKGHAALQHAVGACSKPGRCTSMPALVLTAEMALGHLASVT